MKDSDDVVDVENQALDTEVSPPSSGKKKKKKKRSKSRDSKKGRKHVKAPNEDEDDLVDYDSDDARSRKSRDPAGNRPEDMEQEANEYDHVDDDDDANNNHFDKPLLEDAERKLTDAQRLKVDRRTYNRSLFAMRLGVFADSVSGTILGPNYPFMVIPGAPGAFPNTGPFDFASAQYFIPMCYLLAAALAGVYTGSLSDRLGRRPVMIVCIFMGAVGSVIQYLCRGNFWAFCAANVFTGIFGATLAISIACK